MKNDGQLAADALHKAFILLPSQLAQALKTSKNPMPINRGETSIVKMYTYGRKLRGFWSSAWCQYEVGVGHYSPWPGEGSNVGGVLFFIFPDNACCGSGKYTQSVKDILLNVKKLRPVDWKFLEKPNLLILHRPYRLAKGYKEFPVEDAARDLVWLISNTFSKFETMISGQPNI